MIIQIVTVGNKPRPAINDLITAYQARLPHSIEIKWIYIKHGVGDSNTSINHETEKILKSITPGYRIVLLDETGEQLSSPSFSKKFINPNQNICFIIGGAYGVSEQIKQKAEVVLSLSKLVFPHQIVRLLLTEQIYRAHTIDINHPYHHS